METDVLATINEEKILRKLTIYTFLQKFYAGELIKMNENTWKQLSQLMYDDISIFQNETLNKGIQMMLQFDPRDIMELEYDFNRLFIGPNRLQASPYESTYRNTERAIMQTETLAVRRFYEKAGLELATKNVNPDDHISFELEFVCHLLKECLEEATYYNLYESFLKEHLLQWTDQHCELIRKHTKNHLILGVSYILEGILEVEKNEWKFEGGQKNE